MPYRKIERPKQRSIDFKKKLLEEKNYTCELTGEIGGVLALHHKKPVWQYPEFQFIKSNCIIIKKVIHELFHNIYGRKSTKQQWELFVKRFTNGYYERDFNG